MKMNIIYTAIEHRFVSPQLRLFIAIFHLDHIPILLWITFESAMLYEVVSGDELKPRALSSC